MSEKIAYKGLVIEIRHDENAEAPDSGGLLRGFVAWRRDFYHPLTYYPSHGGKVEIKSAHDAMVWEDPSVEIYPVTVRYYGGGNVGLSLGDDPVKVRPESDFASREDYDDHRQEVELELSEAGGCVFVEARDVLEQMADGRSNHQIAEAILGEYRQWMDGDVWLYDILDADGERLECCSGYYGRDCCIEEAKLAADALAVHTRVVSYVILHQDKTYTEGSDEVPYSIGEKAWLAQLPLEPGDRVFPPSWQ